MRNHPAHAWETTLSLMAKFIKLVKLAEVRNG